MSPQDLIRPAGEPAGGRAEVSRREAGAVDASSGPALRAPAPAPPPAQPAPAAAALSDALAWLRSAALQAGRRCEPGGVLGGPRERAATALLSAARLSLSLAPQPRGRELARRRGDADSGDEGYEFLDEDAMRSRSGATLRGSERKEPRLGDCYQARLPPLCASRKTTAEPSTRERQLMGHAVWPPVCQAAPISLLGRATPFAPTGCPVPLMAARGPPPALPVRPPPWPGSRASAAARGERAAVAGAATATIRAVTGEAAAGALGVSRMGSADGEDWSCQEVSRFAAAFSLYGRDFAAVSQRVGTKPHNRCVGFYYNVWKTLRVPEAVAFYDAMSAERAEASGQCVEVEAVRGGGARSALSTFAAAKARQGAQQHAAQRAPSFHHAPPARAGGAGAGGAARAPLPPVSTMSLSFTHLLCDLPPAGSPGGGRYALFEPFGAARAEGGGGGGGGLTRSPGFEQAPAGAGAPRPGRPGSRPPTGWYGAVAGGGGGGGGGSGGGNLAAFADEVLVEPALAWEQAGLALGGDGWGHPQVEEFYEEEEAMQAQARAQAQAQHVKPQPPQPPQQPANRSGKRVCRPSVRVTASGVGDDHEARPPPAKRHSASKHAAPKHSSAPMPPKKQRPEPAPSPSHAPSSGEPKGGPYRRSGFVASIDKRSLVDAATAQKLLNLDQVQQVSRRARMVAAEVDDAEIVVPSCAADVVAHAIERAADPSLKLRAEHGGTLVNPSTGRVYPHVPGTIVEKGSGVKGGVGGKFGAEVTRLLAAAFELSPFPSRATKIALAAQTGLTPEQTRVWFMNARARGVRL